MHSVQVVLEVHFRQPSEVALPQEKHEPLNK